MDDIFDVLLDEFSIQDIRHRLVDYNEILAKCYLADSLHEFYCHEPFLDNEIALYCIWDKFNITDRKGLYASFTLKFLSHRYLDFSVAICFDRREYFVVKNDYNQRIVSFSCIGELKQLIDKYKVSIE